MIYNQKVGLPIYALTGFFQKRRLVSPLHKQKNQL